MLHKIKTLIVLFISTISLVLAQEKGKIAGNLKDAASGEELIGVAVGIKGSSIGASSDIEGHYHLSLSPGTYTIVVNYVGYKTKEISDVVVVANELVKLDISLEEAVTEMEEIVVTATFKKESVDALMLERKNAVAISDGISADLIKKTPDRNTSDILKRVSGATIQDNKFAIIRGLNERYNMGLVNGTPLPSTESDKKAFSFDLFPANVVDKINIQKVATPDMPGDFAGGIIDITTKEIPDQNFFSFGIGASGNNLTTGQGFEKSKGGAYDKFGFGAETRKLPEGIPSIDEYSDFATDKFSTNKGYPWGYSVSQKVEAAKKMPNTWGSNHVKSMSLAPQFQMSIGRAGRVLRKESGFIFAANYQSNFKRNEIEINRFNPPQNEFDNKEQLSASKMTRYLVTRSTGFLLNFSTKLNDYNKLSFKNTFNQTSDDYIFDQDLKDVSGSQPIVYKYYANLFSSNRILSNQLIGEHFMPKSKLKFNWTVGNNKVERDIPDFKRLTYLQQSDGSYSVALNAAAQTVNEQSGSRFWSNTKENIRSANYSVSRDFKKLWNLNVKLGGFNQFRDRGVQSRLLGMSWTFINSYNPAPTFSKVDISQLQSQYGKLSPDQIFATENASFTTFELDNFNATQSKQWNYTASSSTNATYVMADIKPLEKLRIVGGVRIEAFNQTLQSYDVENKKPVNLNTVKVDRLPSFTTIYSLNSKANLRASYSQTVNRPEFRELAPFPFYDFVTRYLVRGNPNLQRAYVYNTDLRYEYFPGAGQVFSVSVFYKLFENPIEFQEDPGNNTSPDASYRNIKKAINYGTELEWRQNLQSLFPMLSSKVMEYSTISTNLTLINTRAYVDTTLPEFKGAIAVRPLQGQSPYLMNASYTFSHPKHNYSFNLAVNRVGPRIFIVGTGNRPSVIEKPRTIVDFQIAKTFFDKLECKFTFGDLLAQNLIFYQDIDQDGKYRSERDLVFNNWKMSRNYSFSVSYKF
jgi:TonB-dependent receptor